MNNFLTPLAIVIGFGMVAGVLYIKDTGPSSVLGGPGVVKEAPDQLQVTNTSPKRAEDRLLYGAADAPITIVEFSDFECPFCSRLHPTLKQIVDESNGGINWEYRHLPLPSHRTAAEAAVVAECTRELGSNDLFWEYADSIFTSNEARSLEYYSNIAIGLGIEPSQLEACLQDVEIRKIVEADMSDARSLGGSGTPFNIIVFPDGTNRPVRGALPYEQWQAALEM